jgi:hypothetical protein
MITVEQVERIGLVNKLVSLGPEDILLPEQTTTITTNSSKEEEEK